MADRLGREISPEETVSDIKMSKQLAYIIASVNRQLEEELQERLRPAGVPIEQPETGRYKVADAWLPPSATGANHGAAIAAERRKRS